MARIRFELIEPLSESPWETGIRLLPLDAKLPKPGAQLSIMDRDNREIYRTDLEYQLYRVAIEADGRAHHETPAAVLRDRWRQNDLMAQGWTVRRFTWHDLTKRPAYVVHIVRRALCRVAA